MSTFTAGTLADGQLATSAGDLYTVPGATTAYIKGITLFNDNAAEQTIIVWIQRSGGTARKWRRYVLAQNESVEVLEGGDAKILSTGDKIRAVTTTATAVDYTISGILET